MPARLLLVDDSELIRQSLLRLLRQIFGELAVDSASTLAEAMQSAQRALPSLAILDLHLPDGDGVDILKSLIAMNPAIPVAILTNDTTCVNRKRCLAAGARWFFDKSTEFKELLDVVREIARCENQQ